MEEKVELSLKEYNKLLVNSMELTKEKEKNQKLREENESIYEKLDKIYKEKIQKFEHNYRYELERLKEEDIEKLNLDNYNLAKCFKYLAKEGNNDIREIQRIIISSKQRIKNQDIDEIGEE